MDQAFRPDATPPRSVSPSYTVDGLPTRTVAPHGVTGPEIERLSGAVRFMELHCQRKRSGLWWLSTPRGSSRAAIADVQKRVTRLQREHDLPPYNVTALETRGGLHAHIVFIGNKVIAERLQRSAVLGELGHVARVTDPPSLVRKYLAKERTPQAGYRRGNVFGGRLRGSHRMEGGGDRVRLSRELERDAIESGYVSPWQRSNARRSLERKPYRLRRLAPKKAPQPTDQIWLLPELSRPVVRLREFGGGCIPPSVAREIEFRRLQSGLSQRQLAKLIGRSQGQYANAIRGHDPISASAVNRLREVLLTPRRGHAPI